MRAKEFIIETPLPADWDKDVYAGKTSFAKKIAYAKERAKKVGAGSSRVAFEIEFEGRPTVLKIAKNRKGLAQNEYEAQMLDDGYIVPLGITIPMIDYDETGDKPNWIHTEKADKVRLPEFEKYFNGFDPDRLLEFAKWYRGEFRLDGEVLEIFQKIADASGPVANFADLIGNFDVDVGDFRRLANWGIYKGEVVIIDIGGSSEIIRNLY